MNAANKEQVMAKAILIVDPEHNNEQCHKCLAAADFQVSTIADPVVAFDSIPVIAPQLVLVDGALGAGLGHYVSQLRKKYPDLPVLTLVAHDQCDIASDAMNGGAIDYLLKPFSAEQLLAIVQYCISLNKPIPNMVVASNASRQVLLLAKKAARTSASILIHGESGTGKELLSRYIHEQSDRAGHPFVAVNCAAIPETMLESTLFGFSKGAFTGATQAQIGKFELADGGTLVLDEISEMPLPLQAKLLRVLQEREVERLGSNRRIKLNVRIIAATNKDLRDEVAAGRFREDLFYRLDVLPLRWPPLRERPEDILPMARHFMQKHAQQARNFELLPEAAQALLSYSWPGNVRELENVIQRALILARGIVLQPEDLMLPGHQMRHIEPQGATLKTSKKFAEFQHVLDTLRRFNGHRQHTAEALGVTTRALRYKLAAMREQGIDINQLVVNG